ncbi:MAG TPA: protein kinase [Pyrinomonadaceae bacterium]|nr:protein kinase [Pyrinomonadaceae bacterium]
MVHCPLCQKPIPANATSCPSCSDDAATQRLQTPNPRPLNRSDSLDGARFVPGTMLAGRYRIVGLIGKGGMGEVYRADDLKLGQPVALKFLPDRLLNDGASVARFHREVRVARQVSHKNVCRVYDIGEIDGHHFLSMEFIKGEELSSLLRRIGRLPSDKAIQLARQLCAGLSAAHEAGVLHRDLKPANVMIDEDGNARITDFGLAGLAGEFREEELTAGTPAYMAPEQLEGREPTQQTDIYSLGLVLYELFTGKRAFEANTINELMSLRMSETPPTNPTALVKDLDPVIEKVIERCIETEPSRRPSSALQIAAALPGGDPLAAALAAGETPSPEMVAAAPKEGALPPRIAVAFLAGVVLVLAFLVAFSSRVRIHNNVPLEKPPEVLAERAREIIRLTGNTESSADSLYGFEVDPTFLGEVRSRGFQDWHLIRTGQPLVLYFWYRESPSLLAPSGAVLVSEEDPPFNEAGMANVILDPRGRLVRFERLPSRLQRDPVSLQQTDWTPLFNAAALDPAKFTPTQPERVPAMFADERMAWEGFHPDHSQLPVRIEAAALHNKPVSFNVLLPWEWRQSEGQQLTWGQRAAAIILTGLFFALLVGAAFLGRWNLRAGRSDNKGAFRLALFVFLVSLIGYLLSVRHVPLLSSELRLISTSAAFALLPAAIIWLLYIALEPHVRRHWPRLIISWSRLMAGDYKDPMVGRDLLIGGFFGVLHMSAVSLTVLLPHWFGYDASPILTMTPEVLVSWRGIPELLSSQLVVSIFVGMAFMFFLLLLYLIFKREWLAAAVLWVIALVVELLAFASAGPQFAWVASILIATMIVIVTARFGLLATIAFQFTFFLTFYPLTMNFSAWYIAGAILPLLLILSITIYGFYTSLGGERMFKGSLLTD